MTRFGDSLTIVVPAPMLDTAKRLMQDIDMSPSNFDSYELAINQRTPVTAYGCIDCPVTLEQASYWAYVMGLEGDKPSDYPIAKLSARANADIMAFRAAVNAQGYFFISDRVADRRVKPVRDVRVKQAKIKRATLRGASDVLEDVGLVRKEPSDIE